jgi:hypothetical protein
MYTEEFRSGYEVLLQARVQIGLFKNPNMQEVQDEPFVLEQVRQGKLH